LNQFAIKYISKPQFIDIDSSNVKFRLFNKVEMVQKIKYFSKKLNDSIQISLVIQNQKMNNLLNLNWISLYTIFKIKYISLFCNNCLQRKENRIKKLFINTDFLKIPILLFTNTL
jgi:hypothetical protein